MISWAQNFEDALLWQALQDVKEGFYVDVGAADPEIISVTKAFYDLGWHGINIEPRGDLFNRLVTARPRDINLCVAAGAFTGIGRFYHYDRGVGFVADEPALRKLIEAHGHIGHPADLYQTTLNQILADHPPPGGEIHFLKIDVDGSETQVLEGLDLKRWRPWIMVIEGIMPTTVARTDYLRVHQLVGSEYGFVYFDGINSWFVAREQAKNLKTTWDLK